MQFKSFFYSVKANTSETISFVKQLRITRVIIAIFMVYLLFFSENSFLVRARNQIKILGLRREISHHQNEIEDCKQRIIELNSNKDNLEKFAREQYLMKKTNEDIYIVK